MFSPFFTPFFDHPFVHHFRASDAILVHFSCHFASILDAPVYKMKPKMHPHLQQAKPINLHINTHFSLFICSPRHHTRHQNGDQILSKLMTFARCILKLLFSPCVQVLTWISRFWGSFGDSGGGQRTTFFDSFSVLGAPGYWSDSKAVPKSLLGLKCSV